MKHTVFINASLDFKKRLLFHLRPMSFESQKAKWVLLQCAVWEQSKNWLSMAPRSSSIQLVPLFPASLECKATQQWLHFSRQWQRWNLARSWSRLQDALKSCQHKFPHYQSFKEEQSRKIHKIGWTGTVSLISNTSSNIIRGTVRQPNKLLSYAQFCLHWLEAW